MGRRGRDRSKRRRGEMGQRGLMAWGKGEERRKEEKKNEREKSTDGLGWRQVEEEVVEAGLSVVGVCRKPTDLPNSTQPNLTRRVGSVFRAW